MGLLDRQRDIERRRYEYPAALISSVIANTNQHGDRKKRFRPEDFMSPDGKAKAVVEAQAALDPIARLDALSSRFGLNNAGEAEAQRAARELQETTAKD